MRTIAEREESMKAQGAGCFGTTLSVSQCMSRGAPHERQPKVKLNNGKEMPTLALGEESSTPCLLLAYVPPAALLGHFGGRERFVDQHRPEPSSRGAAWAQDRAQHSSRNSAVHPSDASILHAGTWKAEVCLRPTIPRIAISLACLCVACSLATRARNCLEEL